MAVRFATDSLLAAVGPDRYRRGQDLLAAGGIGDLTPDHGGVAATVDGDGRRHTVWAGVVDRALVGECLCDEGAGDAGDEMCVHAVALLLAAQHDGIVLAVTAVPPSCRDIDPDRRRFRDAAEALTTRQLVDLVARHAARDRLFATHLLTCAGRSTPPDAAELRGTGDIIDEAAAIPNGSRWWDLYDIVKAGHQIVAEFEVLTARPANDEMLALLEHAIGVWDVLAGYLYDDWGTYEDEPAEIGGALAEIHLRLCQTLQPDPVDLAHRLATLINAAESEPCLNVDDYTDLLGPEGLAEVHATLRTR